MYLPTKYERSCNVWIQDEDDYMDGSEPMEYAGQFFVGDNYSIMNLGKFYEGQELRIRITVANDDNEAYWKDQLFYTFDYDSFAQTCADMQKNVLEVTSFKDTYLEGTVNAENDGSVLFTTIPYENGWTITVNGKKVTAEKSLDSLITIPLEQGENKITMKFSPDYWKVSLIITGFGVALLVLIFLFEYKRGKVMKKVLAKANFTAESSENATTPVINDTTDTTDEPLRIYRPDNDDDEKLRHINEMMKNILGEDEDSGKKR